MTTVEELIDRYEDVEDLDLVLITRNHCCNIYKGEDINFIDERTLRLPVLSHEYKTEKRKGKVCRILDIEC